MSVPSSAAAPVDPTVSNVSTSLPPLNDEPFDEVAQSFPPSHILANGTFVRLPPPSERERRQFFERAIARHGLLRDDLSKKQKEAQETEVEETKEKETKVHPLALASATLQSNGINELNRCINLSTLLSTGEYFSLSNIVDPSLEIPTAATAAPTAESKANESSAAAPATTVAPTSESALELQEEQGIKASYVLKRKYAEFLKAEKVLDRHKRRLTSAIAAQARPDARLLELRPQWRLVAPEHGTRALPHAARPTELVACDVDVYSRSSESLGRLASRVPRYATIELQDDYKVQPDVEKWLQKYFPDEDAMEVDETEERKEEGAKELPEDEPFTRAEPFAIADPTVGKIDVDFDPRKVTMLSLQFDIEKPSTGFCQSACLEPISTLATAQNESSSYKQDEKVLVALQHSLFCAKLFESIRRELAPDTEGIGQIRTTAKAQSVVWISDVSEENFLPAPSLMARGDGKSGLAPLCVIHCHEGEVKVQLDCEYTLRVKLVEASDTAKLPPLDNADQEKSGSQSPEQLLALCRTLLLHAQEIYHDYSIREAERLRKEEEKEQSATNVGHVLKRVSASSSPRILQSCVSLGTRMIFERRIRKTLVNVNQWLRNTTDERLQVEWLALSIFDLHSQFTVHFRSWSIDIHLTGNELTVTQFGKGEDYRKVKFHSDAEFELFLKMSLRGLIKPL